MNRDRAYGWTLAACLLSAGVFVLFAWIMAAILLDGRPW